MRVAQIQSDFRVIAGEHGAAIARRINGMIVVVVIVVDVAGTAPAVLLLVAKRLMMNLVVICVGVAIFFARIIVDVWLGQWTVSLYRCDFAAIELFQRSLKVAILAAHRQRAG